MVGVKSAQHDRADRPSGIISTVSVHNRPTYSTPNGRYAVRLLHGSHSRVLRFHLVKSYHPKHHLRSLAHLHNRQRRRYLFRHHPRVSKFRPRTNTVEANGADGVSYLGL